MTLSRTPQSLRFPLLLTLCWLPFLMAPNLVSDIAQMYSLAETGNPYWVPDHFFTLYVWMPLVVMSMILLLFSPGLILAQALSPSEHIGEWVVKALPVNIIAVSIPAAVVQTMMGRTLSGWAFVSLITAIHLAGIALWMHRGKRRPMKPFPVHSRIDWQTLILLAVATYLLLVGMLPKFFWENFSGDGAHTFEVVRRLMDNPVPFWPAGAGLVGHFPGFNMLIFPYPPSWFMRLVGDAEVSIRLPQLLFSGLLYFAMLMLIEYRRQRLLEISERALLFLPILILNLALAYSATYNPYHCDIAQPATQDTLQMVVLLGGITFFLRGQYVWLVSMFVIAQMNSPNGVLLFALWGAGAFLFIRPIPWKSLLVLVGTVVGMALMVTALTKLLLWLDLPAPGGQEHRLSNLVSRFRFLVLTDWNKFLYVLIPAGFTPVLALFAWRWQDAVTRALMFLMVVFSLQFYVLVYYSLHYFVPAMVLMVPIFWRVSGHIPPHWRKGMLLTVLLGGLLGLWNALPETRSIHTTARILSAYFEEQPGYPQEVTGYKRSELYRFVFPSPSDPDVPQKHYGGSPLSWTYYANHRSGPSGVEANYVIAPLDSSGADSLFSAGEEDGYRVIVRDTLLWKVHLGIQPHYPPGNRRLLVPRNRLFWKAPVEKGTWVIDMRKIWKRISD